MATARAEEYRSLAEQCRSAALAGPGEGARALRRLRGDWRAIDRRDFFPPPEREVAAAALRDLSAAVSPADRTAGAVR